MDDLQEAVPVLRIFDEQKAREFYVGYLGFTLDWEHRFEPELPLYAQVSRGAVRLHLSEHHGDGTPGSTVLVQVADARALHTELSGRDYPHLRPGLNHEPWGIGVDVIDPFGNSIRFLQSSGDGEHREAAADPGGPIRHILHVDCSSAEAFRVFTEQYDEWWDAAYTPDPDTYEGVDLDPRVGGTVALRHRGSSPYSIGLVTAWEPGVRYGQTLTLAMEPGHPTTLDVSFSPDDGGCRVVFEHGGWTAGNAHCRATFGDWPKLLERYAAATGRG